jgi:hypothetical protein
MKLALLAATLFTGQLSPLSRAFYLNNADWYVDSTADPGGDGLSPATAFDSVEDLVGNLGSNETICLIAGSEFFGTLTLLDGCKVGTGGIGADAIIRADDVVTNWLDSTDRADANTNVYSKTLTVTGNSENYIRAFEDDLELTFVASVATCQSTQGSYTVSSHTATNPTLYIHTSDSSDPDLNGSTYEATIRWYCIDAISADDVTIFGVSCIRHVQDNGLAAFGQRALVDSCTFDDWYNHAVYAGDGSVIQNCTILEHSLNDDNGTAIVFNEDTPVGLGVSALNNAFSNSVYDPEYIGVFGHRNTSGDFGLLTISGNTCTNIQRLTDASHITAMTLTDNTLTNCKTLLRPGEPNITYTLSGNRFTTTNAAINVRTIESAGAATGVTINITDDHYIAAVVDSGSIFINNNDYTVTLTDSLIQITTSDLGACYFVNTTPTGAVLTMNGTTLKTVDSRSIWDLGTTLTYTGDNNIFCVDNDADDFVSRYHNVDYATLALWRTATGQDASSVVNCAA